MELKAKQINTASLWITLHHIKFLFYDLELLTACWVEIVSLDSCFGPWFYALPLNPLLAILCEKGVGRFAKGDEKGVSWRTSGHGTPDLWENKTTQHLSRGLW